MVKMFLYKLMYNLFNDKKKLKLFWHRKLNNFGDVLNPILINRLTSKEVQFVKIKYFPHEHYLCIGSLLDNVTKNTIVWGAGFSSNDDICKEKPKRICAVRGPKSREKLIEQGIDCPEIYGDPALLLPNIYYPKIDKKYKLGIIPHYVDKENLWLKNINSNDILILNILEKNIFTFIDNLLSCEKIVSSSLHGIIVSDAYNIPSKWIKFSNNVLGNDFKFYDYFLSVKRENEESLYIDENVSINQIMEKFNKSYTIDIDLDKLIKSAPFDINISNIETK
jgi:pyruvyltransferase